MSLYARNTLVSSDKSKGEIERTLRRYGAEEFVSGWDRDKAVIMFKMENRRIKFVLPMPLKDDFRKTSNGRERHNEYAIEASWEQAGKHEALIWGNIDDLIEWPDGRVSPWDFKSNGTKRDWDEYTAKYNSLQGDMYDILLPAQGLVTTGDAYFTYSWPIVVNGVMVFEFETVKIAVDKSRALLVIEGAMDCLLGSEPDANPSCDYCNYVAKRGYRSEQEKKKKAVAA
jgi:hypothetical protein